MRNEFNESLHLRGVERWFQEIWLICVATSFIYRWFEHMWLVCVATSFIYRWFEHMWLGCVDTSDYLTLFIRYLTILIISRLNFIRAAWCRHFVLYISFYCFFIYQLKMSFITSCLSVTYLSVVQRFFTSRYFGFLHRQNRQPWYNWSIGERSVNNQCTYHAHLLAPSFLISTLSWKFLIANKHTFIFTTNYAIASYYH